MAAKGSSDARATLDASTTEAELQAAVIELARLRGWLVHHCRPAQRQSGGWSTPIQGDPGFPDVTAVRGGRVLFAELKTQRGRLSESQMAWLEGLKDTLGAEVYVWRPSHWPEIVEVLR